MMNMPQIKTYMSAMRDKMLTLQSMVPKNACLKTRPKIMESKLMESRLIFAPVMSQKQIGMVMIAVTMKKMQKIVATMIPVISLHQLLAVLVVVAQQCKTF